jgi:adenosylcobalamin-dependent ribonucleoside-diphosphate reductase
MPQLTREYVEKGLEAHREFQQMVSAKKYQHTGEHNFEDVLDRVLEGTMEYTTSTEDIFTLTELDQICKIVRTGRFIPAGSILSGMGNTEYKCSLSNCYLTKIENDSIESIFEAVKKLARTYSYRGGSGIDITVLRPCGNAVNNAARTSSGAVSFMPMLSEITNTIGQLNRRGALLISMDIRHPDSLRFIESKSNPEKIFGKDSLTGKVQDVFGANISVKLPDKFIAAVINDKDWVFVFPDKDADPFKYEQEWDGDYDKWIASGGAIKNYNSLRAREIMQLITTAAWQCADPGVIFIDTVQNVAPATAVDPIRLKPTGANPCFEEPMAAYQNCLLGALVLTKYVINPYTEDAYFNFDQFLEDVKHGIYFLDTISDLNIEKHPLKEQREMDRYSKRLGQELTGLADMLAMLGIKYNTPQAREFVEGIMHAKAIEEITASNTLAQRKGPCPAMEPVKAREAFLDCDYIARLDLPEELQEKIERYGLRNTAFNTIGPCGSISIMSGNCTSGIEPLLKLKYKRRTRLSDKEYELIHQPLLEHLATLSDAELEALDTETLKEKFNYLEADEISVNDRIAMQSTLQKYIDSSISSTINLPASATVDDIFNIYITAHKMGLKGITVFRDGCKKGVIEASDTSSTAQSQDPNPYIIKELLDEERAVRHRVLWKGAKMYIIISLDEDDYPVEVFVKLPREAGINGDGHYSETVYQEKFSLWEAVTRLTSLLLRSGMPIGKIIKQLDKSSYSMVDASAVLARILRKYQDNPDLDDYTDEEIITQNLGVECKECGAMAYVFEGGCGICKACGYSDCG